VSELLHGHGFSRERSLVHEQVFGRQHAQQTVRFGHDVPVSTAAGIAQCGQLLLIEHCLLGGLGASLRQQRGLRQRDTEYS